jgi:hypothetical protein
VGDGGRRGELPGGGGVSGMSESEWAQQARRGLPVPPKSTFLGYTADRVPVIEVSGYQAGTGLRVTALEAGALIIPTTGWPEHQVTALKGALIVEHETP